MLCTEDRRRSRLEIVSAQPRRTPITMIRSSHIVARTAPNSLGQRRGPFLGPHSKQDGRVAPSILIPKWLNLISCLLFIVIPSSLLAQTSGRYVVAGWVVPMPYDVTDDLNSVLRNDIRAALEMG